MYRFTIAFSALALLGAAFLLEAQSSTQPARKLTAPTFYIAATAENELQYEVWVRGVTNLPSGAKLIVSVNDYIGEGASALSEQAFPVVAEDGFFKVTLHPKAGKQFPKTSMVCDIAFMPTYPQQSQAVLRLVGGTHGTALPLPSTEDHNNPQAGLNSGEHWYLYDLVSVPAVPRMPNER